MDISHQRVVVGMSGGVDSSTTAVLLQQRGYEVIGITLKVWPQDCIDRAEDRCCGPQAVEDARSVCHQLNVPHYVMQSVADFQRHVVANFVAEYRAGRTPNPCVWCNDRLKFGTLLERADQLGAYHVATGHYARIEPGPDPGRWLLKRGCDGRKDQSYFLFSLKQNQLARALMPLGEFTKPRTREVAHQSGLRTAAKEESMEICFVPDNNYGNFLTTTAGLQKHRGDIVDVNGQVLGHHDGIEFFTIGQRKGLRLSHPTPLYVVDIDPAANRVVVGDPAALEREEFHIDHCNWIPFETPPPSLTVLTKIRYNHPGVPATVTPLPAGRAHVRLHHPQRAVTPGQACVFYDGDVVVGGGWIQRDMKPQPTEAAADKMRP